MTETTGSPPASILPSTRAAGRYRAILRGPGLLMGGGAVLVTGVALNWGWLTAIGIAPILVALLPCAVMCALGLCMPRVLRPATDAPPPSPLSQTPHAAAAAAQGEPITPRSSAAADELINCSQSEPKKENA